MTTYDENTLRAVAAEGTDGARWPTGSISREDALQRLCESGYVEIHLEPGKRTVFVTGEGLDALRGNVPDVDPSVVLSMRLHDCGHPVMADDLRALVLLLAMDEQAASLWRLWVAAVRARAKP